MAATLKFIDYNVAMTFILIIIIIIISFLSDVYGLFDPSGETLWLSVDHRRLRPVDDMVVLSCFF